MTTLQNNATSRWQKYRSSKKVNKLEMKLNTNENTLDVKQDNEIIGSILRASNF